MTICLYSLQSYKDDNDIDLVDSAISDTYTYKSKVSEQIWAQYRYALISNCDIDRWLQRCKDRVTSLHNRYSILFTAYDALLADNSLSSIDSRSTETETRNLAGSNKRTTSNNQNTDGLQVGTAEDLPATSGSSASNWLNARNRVTDDTTVTTSGTDNADTTDTGTVTRDRVSHADMIPAELYKRMQDNLYDPYYEYAREWYDLFVPFYTDEWCRCREPLISVHTEQIGMPDALRISETRC